MNLITEQNADAVWKIVNSKRGQEKPSIDELASLGKENIDVIVLIELAFEKGFTSKEMKQVCDSYWKIWDERQIKKFVERKSKEKTPTLAVIGDTLYTNHGEPLKKGADVIWYKPVYGKTAGILKGFSLAYSNVLNKVIVNCNIEYHDGQLNAKVIQDIENIDGLGLEGKLGEFYWDKWIDKKEIS